MSKRIIVCDDHPAILEVTEEILKSNGFEVCLTDSYSDFLDQLEKFNPDLAMIDLRLPRKSGNDITRKLRSDDEWKDLPVIIFSANHKGEKDAYDAGADGFLCKPFEIDELMDMIKKVTEKRSS